MLPLRPPSAKSKAKRSNSIVSSGKKTKSGAHSSSKHLGEGSQGSASKAKIPTSSQKPESNRPPLSNMVVVDQTPAPYRVIDQTI